MRYLIIFCVIIICTSSSVSSNLMRYGSEYYNDLRPKQEYPDWDMFACMYVIFQSNHISQCGWATKIHRFFSFNDSIDCCNKKSKYFSTCTSVKRKDLSELMLYLTQSYIFEDDSFYNYITTDVFSPYNYNPNKFRQIYMMLFAGDNWVILHGIIYMVDSFGRKTTQYNFFDPQTGSTSVANYPDWQHGFFIVSQGIIY